MDGDSMGSIDQIVESLIVIGTVNCSLFDSNDHSAFLISDFRLILDF